MSNLDLAKRAVACKNWRWMPGMLERYLGRVLDAHVRDGVEVVFADARIDEGHRMFSAMLPDLEDPATLGCLEQLVCDAHGVTVWLDPDWRENGNGVLSWTAVAFLGGWAVSTFGYGPSKAAAWVSALEAAND